MQSNFIIPMYLLAPFIVQNFKKFLRAAPGLWGCTISGPKIAHLLQTRIFWKKSLILFSSTYWPLSLCKIFKNFLQWMQSYEDMSFLGPNGSFAWKRIFSENPLINLVLSIHAYLHSKNQSQIPIHYWNNGN